MEHLSSDVGRFAQGVMNAVVNYFIVAGTFQVLRRLDAAWKSRRHRL